MINGPAPETVTRERPGGGARMSFFSSLCLSLGVLASVILSPAASARSAPAIAAAANVRFALRDIAGQFQRRTGLTVKISYGSSGQLARQIKHGAPFELFISADQAYVNWLIEQGLTRGNPVTYAVGRLALVKAKNSSLPLDPDLSGVARWLKQHKVSRFAIANPEHAPYGAAAEQALKHRHLWHRLQPELILGENAAQAAQFALSDAVQGAIIPLSLAKAANYQRRIDYVAIDPELHQPLKQAMVLTNQAGKTARQFFLFLRSQPAQAALREYGFDIPSLNPAVKDTP